MPGQQSNRWGVVTATERGASHRRTGAPNQDAVACQTGQDGALPLVLAIADGHGHPGAYRSDQGARLAVATAVRLTSDWLAPGQERNGDSPTPHPGARDWLPGAIVGGWRTAVAEHFAANPPTPEELARLAQLGVVTPVPAPLAYGTTLVVVAMTHDGTFYAQLGDGAILVFNEPTGKAVLPVPADPELLANQTTSLCMDNAETLFRFGCQATSPILVVVATDGYGNSFATMDGFREVPADLLAALRTEGLDAVQRALPGWLAETSREGSGDDVTVGLICRQDFVAVGPARPPELAEAQPLTNQGPDESPGQEPGARP